MYVNGQLNAATLTAAIPYSNPSQLWIGADSGRDYLNGKLDELRVENAPRSPNWIAATYQNMASNSVFNASAPAVAMGSNLPPSITEFSLSNGVPSLAFSGAAGFSYIVQASTNLIRWDDLLTNMAPCPAASFPNVGPGSFNQRFYRMKLAP